MWIPRHRNMGIGFLSNFYIKLVFQAEGLITLAPVGFVLHLEPFIFIQLNYSN